MLTEQLQASRWWIAAEARKDGRSWTEIGAALGMTRQAAWEGFRKYAADPPAPSFRRLHDEYRALAGAFRRQLNDRGPMDGQARAISANCRPRQAHSK